MEMELAAEMDKKNGNNDTQEMASNCSSLITTMNQDVQQTNPMLMEDYLEKVCPFIQDRKTLTAIRLVSKTWHKESAPALKKNLRWQIGPNKNSEDHFLQDMTGMTDQERARTFNNFTFTHKKSDEHPVSKHVDQLLQEYGPYVMDLKIKSVDIDFVREHLQTSFLRNLEHLEFYDMSEAVLTHPTLFENTTPPFTKLKSLRFNPDFHMQQREVNRPVKEGRGRICFNILKACPTLEELEINLWRTTRKILYDESEELDLTSLRSFKCTLKGDVVHEDFPPVVILFPPHFANLVKKCPNLAILSVNLSGTASKVEICQMLAKYAHQLEELQISIVDAYNEGRIIRGVARLAVPDDCEEELDNEDGDQLDFLDVVLAKMRVRNSNAQPKSHERKFSFPDFPLLKKLRMLSWFFSDFDHLGNMPLLKEIDLRLRPGVSLEIQGQPAVCYPTVTRLKFRGFQACSNESSLVVPLISVFPNVTELDVELEGDEELRDVYRTLGGQLKRLHLNNSKISDSGITGIYWTKELIARLRLLEGRRGQDDILEFREFPFIGDLEGLQELTYTGCRLTNISVEFGLIWLKNLLSLKFPPYTPPRPSVTTIHFNPVKVLVNVRLLVDNLKHLVKLDVNDDTDLEDDRWKLTMYGEDADLPPKHADKYEGCGIIESDLAYVKEHAPGLEIIFSERKRRREPRHGGGGSSVSTARRSRCDEKMKKSHCMI